MVVSIRRIVLIGLALITLTSGRQVHAQDSEQTYRSEAVGLSFRYPADWTVQEQLAIRSIMALSKADVEALNSGKAPSGLVFTAAMTSFRQLNIDRVENFGALLKGLAQAPNVTPRPVTVGSAEGQLIEQINKAQNSASRTLILSIGKRQVAIVRGVATVEAWEKGAREQFEKILESLAFLPPTRADVYAFGFLLWQIPADTITGMSDLAVSMDGSTLFVTGRESGIWQVGANGAINGVSKVDGPQQFAGIGVLNDGSRIVADPATHTLWRITQPAASPGVPPVPRVQKFAGGQTGDARGSFGEKAPQRFAFGTNGQIYVLDETSKGQRIQVFNRNGESTAVWELSAVQSAPIQEPLISSDNEGNLYLLGRNTEGVIKLSAAGKVLEKNIGREELAAVVPLSLVLDRAENLYVASSEEAIYKLSPKGNLLGILGQPYDESAAPKPGQLARPVAMALGEGGRLLYVLDTGKYPQMVAFAINGNNAINPLTGAKDAGAITSGQPTTGEITREAFIFRYSFTAQEGEYATISMKAAEGSAVDPYLELFDQYGKRLAVNDDFRDEGGSSKDAQITSAKLPFTGTYIIRASRFGAEATTGTGAFTISLAVEKTPRKPTVTPTFTPIPPSNTPIPTRTWTPTLTRTPTNTFTFTLTFTPSRTPTFTATFTPSITLTPSRTFTPSATLAATRTSPRTNTPVTTATPSRTPTPAATLIPSATLTIVPSNTVVPSETATPTAAPTETATEAATEAPAETPTATETAQG